MEAQESRPLQPELETLLALLELMDEVIELAQSSHHHHIEQDVELSRARWVLLRYLAKLRFSPTTRSAEEQRRCNMAFYAPTVETVFSSTHIPPSARPAQAINALVEPRGLVIRTIQQIRAMTRDQPSA